MIEYFFTFLSLLILARVIFSFIGYDHGDVYNFVFIWSEKILKPIRERLPSSPIDWSPLIALIAFDFLRKFLGPLITMIVNGNLTMALYVLYFAFISTLSSLTTLFIILFVVKYMNDLTGRSNYTLTVFIESAIEPIVKRVWKLLPFRHRKHSFWAAAVFLVLLQIILKSQLN